MQATGGLLASAAVVGTASADDGDTDHGIVSGIREAISRATNYGTMATAATFYTVALSPFVAAIYVSDQLDDVNESPTADREILHQLVHSEIAKANAHFVNFGNYLHDTPSVASLEARHGMASAWENGDGAATGYDVALQRIRQYYELPEFNHLHAGNLVLLQLSYIAGSGDDTDPAYEIIASGEDADEEFVQVRISGARQDVELELHDGTVLDEDAVDEIDHIDPDDAALRTPVLEFRADDETTVLDTSPITQDVIDSFDPDDGEVTFDLEDGMYTTDLRFVVPNVGDVEDDPALGSQLAFDGREWLRLRHELVELSDHVTSTYDLSFVEDIYQELDAGNLTPEQVRSPEGMARYLSGTDDPSSERFQIAWMQQFGFARPDFKLVSGMEVEWSGATDTWVDTDPDLDDRHVLPTEYLDAESYSGVLFGADVPDDGLSTGGSYAVGPVLLASGSDGVQFRSAVDPSERYGTLSVGDDNTRRMTISQDGRTLYVVSSDEYLAAVDLDTREKIWEFSLNGSSGRPALSPDGETVYVGDDSSVYAINAADGAELWDDSTGGETIRSAGVTHSGDYIAFGTTLSNWIRFYDPDGNEVNEYSTSSHTYRILPHPTEDKFFALYDSNVVLLDPEENDTEWSYNTPGDTNGRANDIAIGPDGYVYYAGGGEVGKLDPETGDQLASSTAHGIDGSGVVNNAWLAVSPDGERIFHSYDGDLWEFEPKNLGLEWESDSDQYTPEQDLLVPDYGNIDGVLARSIMFDESDGDDDGEGQVDLWNGTVEIVDMWDADGATIEHVTDETIEDIEEIVGEDIEDIIDEMDEFGDVDDIRFRRDVKLILEYYELEDELDDIHVEEPDYSDPDYDTFDSSEFVEAMEALEEYIDQLEDEDGNGNNGGLPDFGGGDWFPEDTGLLAGYAAGAVLLVLLIVGMIASVVSRLHPASRMR